jgi:hypothetical protein
MEMSDALAILKASVSEGEYNEVEEETAAVA